MGPAKNPLLPVLISSLICTWKNCKITLLACGQTLPVSTNLYCIIASGTCGAFTDMLHRLWNLQQCCVWKVTDFLRKKDLNGFAVKGKSVLS